MPLETGPRPPDRLFHASDGPIEAFRPLSHFGTLKSAEDRLRFTGHMPRRHDDAVLPGAVVYPVRLAMRRPLLIPDLGNNTTMEIAWHLETEGPSCAGLTREVTRAVAEAQRSDRMKWVTMCEDVGLLPEHSWLSNQEEAETRAAEIPTDRFVEALWKAYEIAENGPGWMVERLCFPSEGHMQHGRPQNLVCKAVERLGFDGLVYENRYEDRGALSWVNLRSYQVSFALDEPGPARERSPSPKSVPTRHAAPAELSL